MKKILMIMAVCMLPVLAIAEQKSFVVRIKDGVVDTSFLDRELSKGWVVVNVTPIAYSPYNASSPRTHCIIYILERKSVDITNQ